MANVADSKVMSVTGHKTNEMNEHYTHFDSTQFAEVRRVQEALLLPAPKGKEKKTEKRATRSGERAKVIAPRTSAKRDPARTRKGLSSK